MKKSKVSYQIPVTNYGFGLPFPHVVYMNQMHKMEELANSLMGGAK